MPPPDQWQFDGLQRTRRGWLADKYRRYHLSGGLDLHCCSTARPAGMQLSLNWMHWSFISPVRILVSCWVSSGNWRPFHPLGGSSYVLVSSWLYRRHAAVNEKNCQNENCFKWAVISVHCQHSLRSPFELHVTQEHNRLQQFAVSQGTEPNIYRGFGTR